MGSEAYEGAGAKSGRASTMGLMLNPTKPGGAEERIWRAYRGEGAAATNPGTPQWRPLTFFNGFYDIDKADTHCLSPQYYFLFQMAHYRLTLGDVLKVVCHSPPNF